MTLTLKIRWPETQASHCFMRALFLRNHTRESTESGKRAIPQTFLWNVSVCCLGKGNHRSQWKQFTERNNSYWGIFTQRRLSVTISVGQEVKFRVNNTSLQSIEWPLEMKKSILQETVPLQNQRGKNDLFIPFLFARTEFLLVYSAGYIPMTRIFNGKPDNVEDSHLFSESGSKIP